MIILLYIMIWLIFVIINIKVFKSILNYLNVFLTVWTIAVIISSFGFFDFIIPSIKTYIYILLALISFELFSIIFLSIKFKNKGNKHTEIYDCRNNIVILITSAIITLIMIPTTLKGLNIITTQGFNVLRNIYLSGGIYSNFEKIFLTYIIRPLNMALLIYEFVYFVDNRKIKLSFFLCLVNVLQFILTFGGRSILVEILLLACIIICDKYKNIFQIIKKNKKIILLILIGLAGIVYITSQRSVSGRNNLVFNIYTYFIGGIHLFGIMLDNPSISLLDGKHLLYGAAMFNGLIEPFQIMLNTIFNTNLTSTIEIINQVTQKFYYVAPNVLMNNNVTMIYNFLRDYDIFGLIIGPSTLALIYAHYYKKVRKNYNIRNRAIYYYLLCQLPYFLFEFMLSRAPYILTFVFVYLLQSLYCKKQKEDKL